MGAITPITNTLTSLAGTLGTASQVVGTAQALTGNGPARRQDDLALAQLQERQQLQEQQLEQDAQLDRAQLELDAQTAEENRRGALRRAVARQRAQFASSGVTSSGGSSEAVLLGLFEESEDERAQRDRLDSLRNAAIDSSLSSRSGINVLQRTQLEQRQNLQRQLFF